MLQRTHSGQKVEHMQIPAATQLGPDLLVTFDNKPLWQHS